MEEMTAKQFRELNGSAKHKYNAEPVNLDGIRFPSKLEGRYYQQLVTWQDRGVIVGFLRQPMFDLGGGTTYRADFLVFHIDGTCEVIDTKGKITKSFTKARRQVEARYPWIGGIRVVKAEHMKGTAI